jgi:hypothetical protein
MVVVDVRAHEPDEMSLAENHDVVEELSTAGPDPTQRFHSAMDCERRYGLALYPSL